MQWHHFSHLFLFGGGAVVETDTGHIHTAISWMDKRVKELKRELDAQYSRKTGS